MAVARDPDDMLVVVFKHMAMERPEQSKLAGRAVFEDVEMCEIRVPGSRDIKLFPAASFARWEEDRITGQPVKISYAERFKHQYQQFKAQATQTKVGTPLDYLPFLTDARRAELKAQNVYTAEVLAAIDGTELKNLGPGGRDMKNKAIEFIEQAATTAPNKQMEAELEALRARNVVLEEDVMTLRSLKARADAEFEGMSDEQLTEYITAHTGKTPLGNVPRKTLKRMAMEARPDKAA